jgi:putative transposase
MRPPREHATSNGQTYMITSSTWGRRSLFSRDVWANLLIDTLYHYRGTAYLLHEFVVMPDHIHVLFTPTTSLEKAVQFIKGGFSYRAKKELGSNMEVWQKGFSDHRIRDASDCRIHQIYVQQNPVRKHLCERGEEYPYSSARAGFELDPVPQGLKPRSFDEALTARLEGAPLQSNPSSGASEDTPFQSNTSYGVSEDTPFQSNTSDLAPECAPLHEKIASGRAGIALLAAKNKTA